MFGKINMIRCKLDIVNGKVTSSGEYIVYYLPYSLTTLKIFIKNLEQRNLDLLIYPINCRTDDKLCCGFDDNNSGITVLWGGGDEKGIRSSLGVNNSKFAFAGIFHSGGQISSSYNLSLEVVKTVGYGLKKSELEMIRIKLLPLYSIGDLAHMRYDESRKQITFDGSSMCYYCPRWFPELHQNFLPKDSSEFYANYDIPALKIHIELKRMGYDRDKLWLEYDDNKCIGIISGDMDGVTIRSDIFRIFSDAYVIRLWFIWISKNQFREKVIKVDERGIERGVTDPELPDYERYDILFDRNGKIICVGTDFHWQEYWYSVFDGHDTLNATIEKYRYPIKETLSRLIIRAKGYTKLKHEDVNFSLDYVNWLKKQYDLAHSIEKNEPINNLTAKMILKGISKESLVPQERGKNFLRSHVPYVNNGNIIEEMVTKEVTQVQ